ncbi:MAG: asparagine synthase (glutamine-hydrolyzing), partial [Candidatus Eiseniibacteriota bacterium]
DDGYLIEGPIGLGFRRLSIIDVAGGHQPLSNEDGSVWVTFNGEIYNHRELQRDLDVPDCALRSHCDTEILLLAWQRWGCDALPRFAGQFAFAVLDRGERKLWLVRDRFGEKPLYFHRDADRIVFASSLEALIASPGVPRELDPGATAEYLALRYVVNPRTVLRDVTKLSPGHLLEITAGGTVFEREWFAPRFQHCQSGARRSRASLDEEFDHLFTQACERCLVSDVPVGLLLSDGLDSNSIRGALAARGHRPASFTFRLRSGISGAQPTGIQPDPVSGRGGELFDIETTPEERFGALDRAFASLTEPVGDGASLATWMLLREASRRATVFLCGHGGDELLGGYRLSQDRYRLAMLHRLAFIPGQMLDRTLDRYLFGGGTLSERRHAFQRAAPRVVPAAANYLIDRPLPPAHVQELLGGAHPRGTRYLASIERLYAQCRPKSEDLDRIQEVLIQTFLSSNILSFADAVAMDASTELRMPFLDRDLVDFALTLPTQERASHWPGRSNTKLILRRWSRAHLPAEVVRRPKRGFQSGNIAELLQHDGAGLRRRILEARAVRRVLRGVEPWLAKVPQDYGGPWGGTVWALLALGVWCEALGIQ